MGHWCSDATLRGSVLVCNPTIEGTPVCPSQERCYAALFRSGSIKAGKLTLPDYFCFCRDLGYGVHFALSRTLMECNSRNRLGPLMDNTGTALRGEEASRVHCASVRRNGDNLLRNPIDPIRYFKWCYATGKLDSFPSCPAWSSPRSLSGP